jgi:hypothetical protein
MADAFRAQLESADTSQLSFEERFALSVVRRDKPACCWE